MSTDTELGALLRRLRTERGEPLRVVAASAGIDSTLLSRIERAERLPTPPQLEALAAHFGIPVDDIRPMNNAARMLRQWSSVEDVLQAADVLESRSGRSSGRDRAQLREHTAPPEPAAPPEAPVDRAAEPPAREATLFAQSARPAFMARPAAPWQPPSLGDQQRAGATRSDRLADLEEAAAQGAAAAYALSAALSDPDSVVALRAAELLRQLKSRLGGAGAS